jgi:hypothetical protein
MEQNEYSWGAILIAVFLVVLTCHALSGCSSRMCDSCPEFGHGPCPFNEEECCNKHEK